MTQRLIALVAGAVLLVQLDGFGVQYALVKRDLEAGLERLVQADMAGFAALYDQRRLISVRQAIEFLDIARGAGGPVLSLLDRDGRELAGNLGRWPATATIPPEGETGPLLRLILDGQPHVAQIRQLRGRFPLLVARGTAGIERTLRGLRRNALLMALAVLGLGGLIGAGAGRLVMRRIARLNRLADRVAAGDLGARLPPSRSNDEYALLERHIHAMLDRIETLNRATHHLSDTIAHELRTPLTRIQNRLSALGDSTEADAARAELRATIRIFDSLLTIARAEAGGPGELDLAPLDLTSLSRDMVDLYAPLAEDRGLDFTASIDDAVTILGDRNLVAQLISNLLDNALKFCPAGASLHLNLQRGTPRHTLEIRDTGPGLPPGFEGDLFNRFSRADDSTPGHGLGMALMRAIAIRHGAGISLPATQKGFAIILRWPSLAEN